MKSQNTINTTFIKKNTIKKKIFMAIGRPKKEDKKKKVSFTIDPDIYDMWIKYCKDNKIDNQSKHFEKMIRKFK